MAQREVDTIDAALFVIGTLSAGMLVGIVEVTAFDVQFSDTLFSVAGIDLSTAWVLGFAAIAAIIATNENTQLDELGDDIQNLDQYYAVAAAGTILLPIGFVVFPDTIASFFQSTDLWGVVYILLISVGQLALGWML